MSDSKSTSRIIDQLNEQTAKACGADSTEAAQVIRDIGGAAKTTMLGIVSAYQDSGVAAVTTLSTYLQVCIHFLHHACPDGPVVPMLRALADLEDARQSGAPPIRPCRPNCSGWAWRSRFPRAAAARDRGACNDPPAQLQPPAAPRPPGTGPAPAAA
jgi:hypothetical protein